MFVVFSAHYSTNAKEQTSMHSYSVHTTQMLYCKSDHT